MRALKWIAAAAVLTLTVCVCRGGNGERWYLRVIGRDDTRAGQEEKMRVRNAVLAACPEDGGKLSACLSKIKKAARSAAPCEVEIRLWAPGPMYPAAPTLYVTVGAGRGHNWWGVLYEDAVLFAKADEGDETDEPGTVHFVWPLWETLRKWLGLTD